jgi:hypothetical protein
VTNSLIGSVIPHTQTVRSESCPRSVTEFSPGKVLYQHVSIYLHAGMFVYLFICPRSVTESSLGDGNFFFSTTTYGGAYVVVVRGQYQKEIVCGFLRVQYSRTCVINMGISHVGFYML